MSLLLARAQILSRFKHPNIVRVIAFAPDAQTPCILLELCERGSLADALCSGGSGPQMPWTLRLRAALGLAKARGLLGAVMSVEPTRRDKLHQSSLYLLREFEASVSLRTAACV
jgi:serine/threonine protein kinase